jgi:hypothetical protein
MERLAKKFIHVRRTITLDANKNARKARARHSLVFAKMGLNSKKMERHARRYTHVTNQPREDVNKIVSRVEMNTGVNAMNLNTSLQRI